MARLTGNGIITISDPWDDGRQLAVANALGRIESFIDEAKTGRVPKSDALREIEHTMRALYDRLGMQWHSPTEAHRLRVPDDALPDANERARQRGLGEGR